jgi:transcriptional regulator with GAF, ATPase, and Fis domain
MTLASLPTESHPDSGNRKSTSSPTLLLRVVHYPSDALRNFSLPLEGKISVGRDTSPDLALSLSADARVSRRHATLEANGNRIDIIDHQSKNGTFVNGRRVKGASQLRVGDVLRLGDTLLVVDIRGLVPRLAIGTSHVAVSGAWNETVATVDAAAQSNAAVLLLGETGTGKEVLARRLHDASGKSGAFVTVNCAAIPSQLAESTLFGHKRGAFSGAQNDAPGQFDRAENGTLFLDEVAELTLEVQAKLLRVLESGDFLPVGAASPRTSTARIVAATHADLEAMSRAGTFREDLLARLSSFVLTVPALRDRRADILSFVRLFMKDANIPETLSADDAEALLVHPWRRNVREVRNLVQQIELDARLLRQRSVSALLGDPPAASAVEKEKDEAKPNWHKETMEPERFLAAARSFGGNVVRLAEHFSTDRRQVYRWAKRFGVDLEALR